MAQRLSTSLRNRVCNILRTTYFRVESLQTFDINIRAAFFSTGAQLVKENISQTDDYPKNENNLSLYRRLSRLGGQPVSATTVLDKWGRQLKKRDLEGIIRELRKYGDYPHALEVSEWMDGSGEHQLCLEDHAIRLDMIAKVRGIASAEAYFKELPENVKNHKTYGALLNSYVRDKMTEKAEGLMRKIKELGFATTALPYNKIMTLYLKTCQPDKIPSVIQEMKAADIIPDAFTYSIWMQSCAALSDIEGVEKFLDEMKLDGRFKEDWTIYSNLSVIYIEAGYVAKAENALKETEKRINVKKDRVAYDSLISMYAKLGNKVEVHRLWQKLKNSFTKMTNTSYIGFLTALVKLEEIEEVEKCFKVWESEGLSYDIRVPNILIGAYIPKGMLKSAEVLLEQVQEKGGKPNYKTWEMFVDGYLETKQTDQAIEAMKKAISKVQDREMQPVPKQALAILGLFEISGDIDGAEDMFKRLRGVNHVSTHTYNSLLRTYVQSGKSPSQVLQCMKLDNIDRNEETDHLLKQIDEL